MPIEFISITTDPKLAREIWTHPDNTVMVDLERIGKADRQRGRDTVLNAHTVEDVARLAREPGRGPLLVRIESVEHGGLTTIPLLCDLGVDRVMLPMFRDRRAVDDAVEALERWAGGRVGLTLLAETDAAVRDLAGILAAQPGWLEQVHIGLNDLSLERGTPFLFWPVATGEIAELARMVHAAGRRFGFGGVGVPGSGDVPAEEILGEHVRVGSEAVILSRTFQNQVAARGPGALAEGIAALRRWEALWRAATQEELEANHERLREAIERVGSA